jgi:hypothetical protein
MIGSLMSRMADAEKLSIPQLQKSIQDGIIPAYVGVPLLQDKLKQQKAASNPQQSAQPPIAQQVMAEASQHGIDSAPSNLPTEMAGGGIVAFDNGGLSEDDEDDTDNQKQDLAMFQRNLAAIAGDNGEDDDYEEFDDEETPQGIMAAMPRGKEIENRGVGINPEAKGGIGIKDVIAAKAAENKLPPELLNKIAGIESGYKASAANPNSSAKGLFQFTDSTWKGMGGKQGEQFDPEKNAELGAKFIRQNAEGLKSTLGRNPTYGEVYASHFFGLKGAKDLLNMDPKTPMNQAVSAQVLKANPQLKDKTVGQVMAGLNNKMGEGIVALAQGGVIKGYSGKDNINLVSSEDEQQKQDKEDFMMGLKKLGASAADVVTLPVRGAMGAVNTGIVRPIRATGLNLPYIPEEAFGGSSSSMTPYYDKYVRANEKPISTPTQSAPSTPATQQDFDVFDAATRDFEKEQMGGPKETDNERQAREDAAKVNARKATGAGDEDIASLREMLDERSKSLKNQKSIDNYMALLQAGLGMMGGTSPYAAANIGQGASKGITHLADARKAQIADENALLSGRLGLSRAQLYEQSRKDALAAKIASDKGIQAHRTNMYGLGVSKLNQTERGLLLKAEDLYEKKGGDLPLRKEFVKQYGENWANDLMKKKLFDAQRQEQVYKLYNIPGVSDYPSASSLLKNG